MKKIFVFLLISVLACSVSQAKSVSRMDTLKKRTDLITGFSEGIELEQVRNSAKEKLAQSISSWQLNNLGIAGQLSYGKRDQYQRLVRVWMDSFIDYLTILEKPGKDKYQVLIYIDKYTMQDIYETKYKEIYQLIRRGEEALEQNKLGLFFRYFYWALVEIDLLAGQIVEIDDQAWNNEQLIKNIALVVEDLKVKVVGNSYSNGNRRLILQMLYNRRPVNDLRIGILAGDEYKFYSLSERYFQADLFGFDYEFINNITLQIDIQDKATGVWGDEVERLGAITGMAGYEAYRTIPLREIIFDEADWNSIKVLLPEDENDKHLINSNLQSLINCLEWQTVVDSTIFSDYAAINNFTALLKQLNLKNLYLVNRIKRIKTPDGNIWRGFDVQIEFAHGLLSITNMVVQTDLDHKISGVWLGMKPVDYRLLTRSYTEESAQQKINLAVGKVERIYTAALLGEGSYIEEYPDCPQEGWHWGEIEEVNIDLHENAVIYNYKLTLSGAEHSWEFKMQSLEGE
jgi:hypothetical protein